MAFNKRVQTWFDQSLDSLTFRDSWLSGRYRDFGQWRRHARSVVIDDLGPVPDRVPLNVKVLAQEDRGSYTATLLSYEVDAVYRTEAYLLMPKGEGPFPGVAVLHDHGAFFYWGKEKVVASPYAERPTLKEHVDRHYGGRYVADELARRGYAVISNDQWLWGMQRAADVPGADRLDLNTEAGVRAYHQECMPDFERQVSFALTFAGRTMPGQMVYNDQRALDVLMGYPQVDAARVGCVGLSVGAFRTVHLTAVDERVRASVEIGWMCALQTYLKKHDHLYRWPNVLGLCTPSMARHLDYPDLVGLACPRPFLLMAGRQDGLYPPEGVQEAFDKIRAVYTSQGVDERLGTRWYDVPHCFNVPMQEEAFVWLDRWLRA